MKKSKRNLSLWLCLTVFAFATGVPSALLAVLMAIKMKYFVMSIFVILALHGIWGGVFYYKAYLGAKLEHLVLLGYEAGNRDITSLSEHTGIVPDEVGKILTLIEKKGYIGSSLT